MRELATVACVYVRRQMLCSLQRLLLGVHELLHVPALSLMVPSDHGRIRAAWKAINLSDRATGSFTKQLSSVELELQELRD
jgi:hypothetical protein